MHVSVPPTLLQFGLLTVRLVAIDSGLPEEATPLTLASVMITDAVDGETNFGFRTLTDAVTLFGGTMIVNFAVVCALVFAGGVVAFGAAGRLCEPPPPHAVKTQIESTATERRRNDVFILLARSLK